MDLTKSKDLITNIIKVVLSKVSYIIPWGDTNTLSRTDPKHYNVNERDNKALLKHTSVLLNQKPRSLNAARRKARSG